MTMSLCMIVISTFPLDIPFFFFALLISPDRLRIVVKELGLIEKAAIYYEQRFHLYTRRELL